MALATQEVVSSKGIHVESFQKYNWWDDDYSGIISANLLYSNIEEFAGFEVGVHKVSQTCQRQSCISNPQAMQWIWVDKMQDTLMIFLDIDDN